MSTSISISKARLITLLAPYLGDAATPPDLYPQIFTYVELLLKWNARTNLTAIRDPEMLVCRQFGESLFCGLHLPADTTTVLDLGSGAGFPGLPIQLLRPNLQVTLAESQNKKASFLREAVRALGLKTEVWAERAESMPADRLFSTVTLRAVDHMEAARAVALTRVAPGGCLVSFISAHAGNLPIPGTSQSYLHIEYP